MAKLAQATQKKATLYTWGEQESISECTTIRTSYNSPDNDNAT